MTPTIIIMELKGLVGPNSDKKTSFYLLVINKGVFTMRKLTPLAFIVMLGLALGLSSCAGLKKKRSSHDSSASSDNFSSDDLTLEVNGDSDSGKAGNLRTITFAFNSATLNHASKKRLKAAAKYLKNESSIEIQIEGHCDERGGVQYNLALGEKRARTVRQYLISLGVPSKRVSTISFGKERPVSFGHNEDSWGKNRRANFVITAK